MRKTAFAASLLFLGFLAAPASAVPATPSSTALWSTAAVQLAVDHVAIGCGVGRARDAAGHCRRRFNLFDQHRGFRAYKQRHCTPMMTPNGRVNRCKI